MKLLLDECVLRPLKTNLSVEGHECLTVPEAGFAGKSNGELLRLAASQFDVFVTLDKDLPYQQNLPVLGLSILLISAKSNRLVDLLPHIPACLTALRSIAPGELIRVGDER